MGNVISGWEGSATRAVEPVHAGDLGVRFGRDLGAGVREVKSTHAGAKTAWVGTCSSRRSVVTRSMSTALTTTRSRRLRSHSGERRGERACAAALPRAYQEPTTFHTTSVIATDEAS